MAMSLDKALGIHATALVARAQRAEVLANNIANADTPGFKASDMDFAAVMKQTEQGSKSAALVTTNGQHIGASSAALNLNISQRSNVSASLNGNTVDNQREISAFTENALRYQASLTFLSGRVKGLLTAIRGD